jgi:hypothetical protein
MQALSLFLLQRVTVGLSASALTIVLTPQVPPGYTIHSCIIGLSWHYQTTLIHVHGSINEKLVGSPVARMFQPV